MPIEIIIIKLPKGYSRSCDFCNHIPKTYNTLKLMAIGGSRFKICNACLKKLHDKIHGFFTHTVVVYLD